MTAEIKGVCPLIQVYDMATSLKFYCDVLGCEVVSTDSNTKPPDHNWVWLRLQGADLMLNTAYDESQRPPQPDAKRVAVHDDTCLYFGAPDVDAVYRELTAKGLKLNPPKVAWYGMKQLYLHDPDGYGICFQWQSKPE